MSQLKLSQAKTLLNKGQFKEALDLYQELMNDDPQNAVAHQNASVILGELKRYTDALNMSMKALEIDPNLVIPHVTMAYVYDELGNKVKSREEVKIALGKDAELVEALCCAGILSLRDNRLEDAVHYFEKTIRINPSFYWAQYNLAAVYQNQKDSRNLFRQVVVLFRLKPNIKNLFRLIFVLNRSYKFMQLLILLLSAFLSPIIGPEFVLVLAFLLMAIWFAGGIFIGVMAERRSWRQLLINMLVGTGIGIFGVILYLWIKIA